MSLVYWDSMLFIYYFEAHPEYGPRIAHLLNRMEAAGILSVPAHSPPPRYSLGCNAPRLETWRHASRAFFDQRNSAFSISGSQQPVATRRSEVSFEFRQRMPFTWQAPVKQALTCF
jgi:hypothetical protein